MTDPQRRAVEAEVYKIVNDVLDKWIGVGVPENEWDLEAASILAALRAADLVIVNRADVAAAVRFAEVHSPRYNRDYEFMQHFREELDDDI